MKSQPQKLCHAMDEIIAGFHFYQPFRLGINDQLDFILQYPNKLTRPIGKASGGERIILGFAFRLAAHRTLCTRDALDRHRRAHQPPCRREHFRDGRRHPPPVFKPRPV